MEEIISALTKLAIERTMNPFIRFIVRKTSKPLKIKAYKELTLELFLHSEGKNTSVLKVQQSINTSGIDDSKIWNLMEPFFTCEVLKWVMSEEGKEMIDGYKVE